MRRLAFLGLFLLYIAGTALGFYEFTAKSPILFGTALPGWDSTHRAENSTPWNPPTGFLPLDKILHESQEACVFYGLIGLPRDSR